MTNEKREILVTSALPYANGAIHIGHMLGYIQTDIWVRFQRSQGHECYFAWADDAHGTPVMLTARAEDTTPEELIDRMNEEHKTDFRDFGISYDNYSSTHSEYNRQEVERIYQRLDEGGHIARRIIKQLYDEEEGMFLPDRFIRGTCPKCGTEDQYGDSCESCGGTYSPTDLLNPRSAISGSKPVFRESEHYFVRLAEFEQPIKAWMASGALQDEVANKMQEWFTDGLRDWDISRDAPYFGFRIPGTQDKYFYVWVDAPIGYISSFRELCEREGLDFDHWWNVGSETEVYHFIGKDIVYFHTLFWPGMLKTAGYSLPTKLHIHGFVTVDGEKMSKSKGNVTTPLPLLEKYTTDAGRYWAASARLGVDTAFDEKVWKIGKRLVTKLYNAGKFVLSQEAEEHPIACELDLAFSAHLKSLVEKATVSFDDFNYAHALMETESFFWTHFTDTYLELVKNRARAEDPGEAAARGSAVAALRLGLDVLLRQFAPFLPYITEEVWSWVFADEKGEQSIHRAPWPGSQDFQGIEPPSSDASFDVAVACWTAINKSKADAEVSMGREALRLVIAASPKSLALLEPVLSDVLAAARCLDHELASRPEMEEGTFEILDAEFAPKP